MKILEDLEGFGNWGYKFVDEVEGQLENAIEKAENVLVPLLVRDLQKYHDDLERDLKNRQTVLQRHREAMEKLGDHQSDLKKTKS